MPGLIFNEEALLNNNIQKFETRLLSPVNKFSAQGAILTTYYNLHENSVTVDRGLQDVEQLFGRSSPLRWNSIINFPLYDFGQANPANTDEAQVEDINIEGECTILPATIVPHPDDFFILNHLKMRAVFRVLEVIYDSMKPEGFYKIRYRLQSSSKETLDNLRNQTVNRYRCLLDAIGTDLNPIIQVDDAIRRSQLIKIVNQMVADYKSLFYNSRHNCFLFKHKYDRWFDLCANEFIAKHSLMNNDNATNVIMLQSKLNEPRLPLYYQQSIYRWIEDHAPLKGLHRFPFRTIENYKYHSSTFKRWSETDIKILVPELNRESSTLDNNYALFNTNQINFFMEKGTFGNDVYEQLIKLYIQGELTSISQISLDTGNLLSVAISDKEAFFLTPIIIYIIRFVLRFN